MPHISTLGVHESVDEVFPAAVFRDALADAGPSVEIVDSDDDLTALDALVTFEYEEYFLDAGLDWIHSIQAGVDRFPFDALQERGIALTNSTGIHGDVVGETAVGLMLSFARRLHAHRSNQERGEWVKPAWDDAFPLRRESACVVGLGTLGRGIATRASALGMDVTGVKRTPTPVDGVDEVYPPEDLHDAIADARFVALAVPLTDDTEKMMSTPEFEAMRDDAYVINVARGPVVDQSALVDALDASEISGAGLDVFETEPLPADSTLWDRDEVILTPHAAGFNEEYYERVATIVRENLRRQREGESLTNRVV
ncbi:D-2-hydroxyacid dehydrogenase [Haloplanus aerogenes]|uniref:D-2-hydroxyacid dehydrogenase n=1 Tax=Haloplanus aerogenes TaxID=660522 RepID=A0A3M0DS21_9EURY|nr:D-2-hydroxyacid dehydrogenase [Haloplanus aerogenes]AZH24158.1 D-2-hydroxyacid dehydrogenase [Haloplanus aerogenes]RMB24224.1 D-2-hydroxyacid dehydrogenase (NADP+) [Haloplanus aerogenes]